jgi:membrane-associated phospholipid phosphatase
MALMAAFVVGVYLPTNYFADYRSDVISSHTFIEASLPLVPSFVYIYTVCYVCLLISPVLLLPKKSEFTPLVINIIIVTVLSGLVFLVFPSTTHRPLFTPTSFTEQILIYLYVIDSPNNCFPSLHVSMTVLVALALCQKYPKTVPISLAVMICISTVLTKQHAIIDVVTGVFVALFIHFRNRSGIIGYER